MNKVEVARNKLSLYKILHQILALPMIGVVTEPQCFYSAGHFRGQPTRGIGAPLGPSLHDGYVVHGKVVKSFDVSARGMEFVGCTKYLEENWGECPFGKDSCLS